MGVVQKDPIPAAVAKAREGKCEGVRFSASGDGTPSPWVYCGVPQDPDRQWQTVACLHDEPGPPVRPIAEPMPARGQSFCNVALELHHFAVLPRRTSDYRVWVGQCPRCGRILWMDC